MRTELALGGFQQPGGLAAVGDDVAVVDAAPIESRFWKLRP